MRQRKGIFGKIWYFLWEDNSVWSWIVVIILAFLIIKFAVYPGLGLIVGTKYPIVAVISSSMDHGTTKFGELCGTNQLYYEESFDNWWGVCGTWYEKNGIRKNTFLNYPLHNGFKEGDLIFLKGEDLNKIEIGDIIVFWASNLIAKPDPIIHRVVEIKEGYVFVTKGDHNRAPIIDNIINEGQITEARILGTAMFKVPWLGYLKIGAVDLIRGLKK